MSDDWKRDDLALCLKGGVCPHMGRDTNLKVGKIYRVAGVGICKDKFDRQRVGFTFTELTGRYFNARYFMKVTPEQATTFDWEVIELMNGAPVGEPVA